MKPPTECIVAWCRRSRQRDALYCPDHLNDVWANREPEWMRRRRTIGLPPKDLTRAA